MKKQKKHDSNSHGCFFLFRIGLPFLSKYNKFTWIMGPVLNEYMRNHKKLKSAVQSRKELIKERDNLSMIHVFQRRELTEQIAVLSEILKWWSADETITGKILTMRLRSDLTKPVMLSLRAWTGSRKMHKPMKKRKQCKIK